MIKRIEIRDVGQFDVTADMTHRPRKYLKLKEAKKPYHQVQFDSLDRDIPDWQRGYNNNGDEIKIRIL